MGTVYFIDNHFWFLLWAFGAQITGGIGAGLNSTTSIAILTSNYKDERDAMMGYLEAATGLGFLFGPMIGSASYAVGGFILPFYGLGSLYLLLYPCIAWSLIKLKRGEDLIAV